MPVGVGEEAVRPWRRTRGKTSNGEAAGLGMTPSPAATDFQHGIQNWSELTTSPPARVERKLKIRGLMVSLRNRTEPSQNRKLQPPGCRLQKSSAPAAL